MTKNYFEHVNIAPVVKEIPGVKVEECHSDTSRVKFMSEFQKALEKKLPLEEEELKNKLLESRVGWDGNGSPVDDN